MTPLVSFDSWLSFVEGSYDENDPQSGYLTLVDSSLLKRKTAIQVLPSGSVALSDSLALKIGATKNYIRLYDMSFGDQSDYSITNALKPLSFVVWQEVDFEIIACANSATEIKARKTECDFFTLQDLEITWKSFQAFDTCAERIKRTSKYLFLACSNE